jgi:hypothetical protein
MYLTWKSDSCLAQVIQVTPVIGIGKKAWIPIVTALNHMLGDARQIEAGFAWNGSPPCEQLRLGS